MIECVGGPSLWAMGQGAYAQALIDYYFLPATTLGQELPDVAVGGAHIEGGVPGGRISLYGRFIATFRLRCPAQPVAYFLFFAPQLAEAAFWLVEARRRFTRVAHGVAFLPGVVVKGPAGRENVVVVQHVDTWMVLFPPAIFDPDHIAVLKRLFGAVPEVGRCARAAVWRGREEPGVWTGEGNGKACAAALTRGVGDVERELYKLALGGVDGVGEGTRWHHVPDLGNRPAAADTPQARRVAACACPFQLDGVARVGNLHVCPKIVNGRTVWCGHDEW